MYQVGFGDCFLLTFEYDSPLEDGRSERHVLIDFGTTSLAKGQEDLVPIARLIQEHSGETLDVVVVTHRHKDHLSAFGSRPIAEILGQPKLVVRSWTEDPAAPEDPRLANRGVNGKSGHGVASLSYRNGLRAGQEFANSLARSIQAARSRGIGRELQQMAFDQLSNEQAVDQLTAWAKGGRGRYVSFGQRSGVEDLIPGIDVSVLGPPTLEQHPQMAKQRESDEAEFWMLYRQLVEEARPLELLGARTPPESRSEIVEDLAVEGEVEAEQAGTAPLAGAEHLDPGPARFLIDQMGRQQINSFLRIVRILDKALNNTSVILLFEVESAKTVKRMLFAGDAQIENWEYSLKVAKQRDDIRRRLGLIDLYKVGHHGSRNATPRTLFNLWNEEPQANHPMTALLSTKSTVHGESPATAVPRETLVKALRNRMDLHSTEALGKGPLKQHLYVEVLADLSKEGGFETVRPSSATD